MSKWLAAAVGMALVLVAISCCPLQRHADTPGRVNGLTEPTISEPAATWQTERDRLALIKKAMAHRTKLLQEVPPPIAPCRRVSDGGVEIDGVVSAEEWETAAVISGFRLHKTREPVSRQTRVMMLWDSRYLYFAFDCEDADLLSTITEHDGDIWTEDAAEIFIDANRDEMSYIDLEVNPLGYIYDATISDYRADVDWSADLNHLDTLRGLETYHTRDMLVGTSVKGTLNQPEDEDSGWSCELAVSWDDIARGTNVLRVPPRDGDMWRIGLYRIDRNADEKARPKEYGTWNPTVTWFHEPWVFGRVIFVE